MSIGLIIFIAIALIIQVKKIFHWKYLKAARKEFSKYDTHSDYQDSVDMSCPTDSMYSFGLAMELLLPYFWKDKADIENEESKKYAKIIFIILAVVYALIGLLIWRFIESGKTISFDF